MSSDIVLPPLVPQDVALSPAPACSAPGVLGRGERLLGRRSADPGDPEVPNEEVARILKDLFGDRPIRKGHLSLDMPAVAEDGASFRSSSRATCR